MANGLYALGSDCGDRFGDEPSTSLPVRSRNSDLDQLVVGEGALDLGTDAITEPLISQGYHWRQAMPNPTQPFSGAVVETHVVCSARGARF